MAEAILVRSTTIPEEILNPIYPSESYHKVLVTLRNEDGVAITNAYLNCKDGSTNYNYKTNEKGQCLFTVNSGAANILATNNIEGYIYPDILNTWMNIDAPVGEVTRVNLVHNKQTSPIDFTSSKIIRFMSTRELDLYLIGGGGGGGAGWFKWFNSDYEGQWGYGGGGGGGNYNLYNNIVFEGGNNYNFQAGAGGAKRRYVVINYWRFNNANGYLTNTSDIQNGGAGGTSYIVGTEYSATGGQGGKANFSTGYTSDRHHWATSVAIGGTGNGGYGRGWNALSDGSTSPLSFAGGGGGAAVGNKYYMAKYGRNNDQGDYGFGGSPYGGNGCSTNYQTSVSVFKADSGSRGGGGGGGGFENSWYNDLTDNFDVLNGILDSGSGGAGMMRIIIH